MEEHYTYYMALQQLPIENPTVDQIAQVCPHMSTEQIETTFMRSDSVYLAAPPIRIRHGFQILNYYIRQDTHDIYLDAVGAGRTRKSYADGKPHGDVFHDYRFMNEAMAYAEAHWDENLILDSWDSFGQFVVQDPTQLDERGYPTTAERVYWTSSRDWNDIFNDPSNPRSVTINNSLIEITMNRLVASELRGGRGGYSDYNCAHCGGGLGLSICNSCGHRFKDDKFRSGWGTPLPQKVVDLLSAHGHVFKVNPAIAQIKEREAWEKRVRA